MIQEVDFEDELRSIEDDVSSDEDPRSAGATSISAAVPGKTEEIGSPSAKSGDVGNSNKRHATSSPPSSPMSKTATTDVTRDRHRFDGQEPQGDTSHHQRGTKGGTGNISGKASNNINEDETLSRHQSHPRSNDGNHGAEPRNRKLAMSVMKRTDGDQDDWPEVSENPADRDFRKGSTINDTDSSWRNGDEQSRGHDRKGARKSEREARQRYGNGVRDGADSGDRDLDRDDDVRLAHEDPNAENKRMGRKDSACRDSARKRGVEEAPITVRASHGRGSSSGAHLGGGDWGHGHGGNRGDNYGDFEDRWQQGRNRASREDDRQTLRGDGHYWELMNADGRQQQQQQQRPQQLPLQQENITGTRELETKVQLLQQENVARTRELETKVRWLRSAGLSRINTCRLVCRWRRDIHRHVFDRTPVHNVEVTSRKMQHGTQDEKRQP